MSLGHPATRFVRLPSSPALASAPSKTINHRARDAELIDFFQNAPIAMHWLNGEGIVLWANQTELNVLGYTAEEYIGKPIMNFCPDERDLVLEIFKQLGSGNAIADVPVRFRTKDDRIVHLLIDSNVAYNRDGSFGHTRCFIRDDTARKVRDARSKLLLEETERVRHAEDADRGGGCAK
jgi:PAS domain S-box-containing protein